MITKEEVSKIRTEIEESIRVAVEGVDSKVEVRSKVAESAI